jgi:hypothetical protein
MHCSHCGAGQSCRTANVMNMRDEIVQAVDDYRDCRMGMIALP